ncbi:DUF2510 domain-containing protein [Streptomyces sp. col6]|uniref:DUF2510 domain-containing protein n=1 Tax=Streptomyces sp. col6 TaxID=2478958 RepID=UPI0011CD895C|nr:DUF2510 domain-containing protein [Streptomyces sp. col6]TXS03478.1 DUF2510 domain-containing protein [Streptomyces sp. col6]
MSMPTPPGWYPDTAVPGTERWWDGTAWTAHTRAAASADQPPVPPRRPGASGGTGARTIAIVAAGALVVAAAVTGAVLLTGRDDDAPPTAARSGTPVPSASHTPTGKASDQPSLSPGDSAADKGPARLVDQLNGITLPIPDGWEKVDHPIEEALMMRPDDSEAYFCPGTSSAMCFRGTVTIRTATRTDLTSPEEIAKKDIVDAANLAYDRDVIDRPIHGGLLSHRQISAEAVTVAGRSGYQVRWRVVTGKGPGGYVQSLVFPSPVGSESPVIVRCALDAGPDGPPLALMDTLTKGIRPIGDDATDGGVGNSVEHTTD